jgi:hypothetical protein
VARQGAAEAGPRSLGKAARFVVDHAACPVLLVWPGPVPEGPPRAPRPGGRPKPPRGPEDGPPHGSGDGPPHGPEGGPPHRPGDGPPPAQRLE